MPKVSVIVPNYNHAPYLRQRIDSILNQTFQDFELILLDDCSTDNSCEILEDYRANPHVTHIVFNESNSGTPFRQWDKGIELAQGEWIWIAESDDWAEPEFLQSLMNESVKYPQCGLVFSLARYMCGGKELWNMYESGDSIAYGGNEFVKNRLVNANVIYNVSMVLFKRCLYAKVNPSLYEDMRLCGDWFFYAQLCTQTGVLEVNKVLSNYRVHSTNTSSAVECEGGTFTEGIRVLDYMLATPIFNLHRSDYAKSWGKAWVKYSQKYKYTHEVNHKIYTILSKKHLEIIFWYMMYKIWYSIKKGAR